MSTVTAFEWDLNSDLGYFWINELQVRWNQGDDTNALPGQAKFGAWFHTASFADPFFDEAACRWLTQIPVATRKPILGTMDSTGSWTRCFTVNPEKLRSPLASSKDGKSVSSSKESKQIVEKPSKQGLGWFGRIAFEPQDRNFVGFYFEIGSGLHRAIPTRDEDQLGVGFAYAQLTNGARKTLELEGSRGVGAEMVLEFTYKVILTPWLYIKPDAQFIINPGATQDLNNAFVIGGRVSVNF